MKNDSTRTELMAIPIVASCCRDRPRLCDRVGAVSGPGFSSGRRSAARASSWRAYSKRHPHPALVRAGAAAAAPATVADGAYRVLVIADESCVDPGFSAELAAPRGRSHGRGARDRAGDRLLALALDGRRVQYAMPASTSTRPWRRSPRAGISASGETGADDPLQAADDGLREFGADEIVFVTKPGTDTDWVEQGVVEAARKRYAVPVTHIALPAA